MTANGRRPRSDMEPEQLAGILRRHIKSPVWLRYPERLDDVMKPDILVVHKAWLLEIKAAQPNMAISQALATSAFRL
eukprot:3645699-Alexandrium_andersonii.AAC.1